MRRPSWQRGRPKELLRRALGHLARRMPWYTPGGALEQRNVRSLYAETVWFGVLSGLAATFVSVYALRLGASTDQVGWLVALPALVNVVWLVPAARLIERQRKRMPLIITAGLLQRLGYFAMAAMPSLLKVGLVEALIALNTLVILPTAIISTAVTALIPDLTAPEHRGQVVSVRWLILAVTATLASLLGGSFLELLPVPVNYQALLGIGAALSLLSLVYLRRIQIPDALPARRPERRKRRQIRGGWRASFAAVLSHRTFVRFAVASFVFHWGLYLPAALWSVLRVRNLGASDAWIGFIAVVIDGSTIAGYLLWSRVRARRGDVWLLKLTAGAVTAYALLTAGVPTVGWMIPTSILGGLAWSGCNLALFNVMLSACPDDHRASYVALYTALMNVAAFAGPLLGAALSDGIGIRWAFVMSGAVRLVGSLLFVLLVRVSPRQ